MTQEKQFIYLYPGKQSLMGLLPPMSMTNDAVQAPAYIWKAMSPGY